MREHLTSKSVVSPLRVGTLRDLADIEECWGLYDLLRVDSGNTRPLYAAFACSEAALSAAFRLRYEVFSRELGHGTATAGVEGQEMDHDQFDAQMVHLLLIDRRDCRVVGTYRLQTAAHARSGAGLYSAQEYDLSGLSGYLDEAVECGRLCIAAGYRKATALLVLWYGLRVFMDLAAKRWLIGCCSIPSDNEEDGWRALETLRDRGYMHADLFLPAQSSYACRRPSSSVDVDAAPPIVLPRLFATYMRLGATVVSEPAYDCHFGSIDFLVMADGMNINMAHLGL